MAKLKPILFLLFVIAFIVLLRSPLMQELSLESIKAHVGSLQHYFHEYPLRSMLLYLLIYTFIAGLSLPGAVPLTLAGGAIFGLLWGTFAVSIGSTLGATFAFLSSRFLFRDLVRKYFGERIHAINEGFQKDGASYLLALRFIPLFPYFLVNIGMGLTTMRTRTFMWVSQIGMLPASIVYVNAGMEIGKIDSLRSIFTVEMLISFTLIGILPFIMKGVVHFFHKRKVYKNFRKPKSFNYNMMVIGGGSGGLITSYISAASRAKVALVEKDKMGGECLYRGCVPSKALIKAAQIAYDSKNAQKFGFHNAHIEFDFAKIMEHVHERIQVIAPHDSPERYTKLGVDCIHGEAKILTPWEVQVGSKTYTTRSITLATGSRPRIPNIPGIEKVSHYTSDTIWNLKELPKRLLILGGGPIACEMAQCFARFGSEVTLVQKHPRILVREDADVSALITEQFEKEGIRVLTNCESVEFSNSQMLRTKGHTSEINFDTLLIATGRTPNTENLGLENLNLKSLELDSYLRTSIPNIYACGDVVGPYRFTHMASYQAVFCALNGLFGHIWKLKPSYRVVPWCTFTSPEVASVGLNEQTAKERGIEYTLTKYDLKDLDRAIVERNNFGFLKVLTSKQNGRILGASIVAPHAGEMITEFVSAMQHNMSLKKIMSSIHVYPTHSEANKLLAGVWSKNSISPRFVKLLSYFHKWSIS